MQADFQPTSIDASLYVPAGKLPLTTAQAWLYGAMRRAVLPALTLAGKLGTVTRGRGQQQEEEWTDPQTALYNHAGLMSHGNVLLARCRREQRPVCLAVFDCVDLLEVRTIYGNRISRKLIDCLVRKLTALAGPRGLAARTGPTQFAVLMPSAGRDKAIAAIHKVWGSPTRIELDAGDSEIVLVPEVAVDAFQDEHCAVHDLFLSLCRSLQNARCHEDQRQRYLRRERERHSRPMGLAAT